jgi:hypothetical protein
LTSRRCHGRRRHCGVFGVVVLIGAELDHGRGPAIRNITNSPDSASSQLSPKTRLECDCLRQRPGAGIGVLRPLPAGRPPFPLPRSRSPQSPRSKTRPSPDSLSNRAIAFLGPASLPHPVRFPASTTGKKKKGRFLLHTALPLCQGFPHRARQNTPPARHHLFSPPLHVAGWPATSATTSLRHLEQTPPESPAIPTARACDHDALDPPGGQRTGGRFSLTFHGRERGPPPRAFPLPPTETAGRVLWLGHRPRPRPPRGRGGALRAARPARLLCASSPPTSFAPEGGANLGMGGFEVHDSRERPVGSWVRFGGKQILSQVGVVVGVSPGLVTLASTAGRRMMPFSRDPSWWPRAGSAMPLSATPHF